MRTGRSRQNALELICLRPAPRFKKANRRGPPTRRSKSFGFSHGGIQSRRTERLGRGGSWRPVQAQGTACWANAVARCPSPVTDKVLLKRIKIRDARSSLFIKVVFGKQCRPDDNRREMLFRTLYLPVRPIPNIYLDTVRISRPSCGELPRSLTKY
jgi:hypothetical protein